MEEHLVLHELGTKALSKFGNNPFGQPMYRVVRADSRRQWLVSEYAPKYPKYGTCWVIEKWCPPEQYGSREEWEEAGTLGPFPTQGDYEMSYPLLDDGVTYDPSEDICMTVAALVEKSAGLTRSQRWSQINQAKEDAREQRMKILRDMIADAAPLSRGSSVAVQKHADELAKPSLRPAMPVGPSLSRGEAKA